MAPRPFPNNCICIGVVLCLSVLIVGGCGEGTSHIEPIPEDLSRASPDRLLEWYAYAVEHEDINMFGEALHDNSLFFFDEIVPDSLGLPEPWWGKTAELAAMGALFEDTTVVKIEFEFTSAEPWTPTEFPIEPDSLIIGVFTRATPVMRLAIQEPGQEPKTLVFDDTYFDIVVVRDPKFPDKNLWVIARIEEVPMNPG
jgi:hypothetical protein